MKYYIGIDPGKSGAISILNKDGDPLEVIDMPTRYLMKRKVRVAKSKYLADGVTLRKKAAPIKQDARRVLDARKLYDLLKPYVENLAFCGMEQVSSQTGQGVSSSFSFGEVFGAIKGVLESLGINYGLIQPKTWQKEFLPPEKAKDKDEHKNNIMLVAKSFYPNVSYHGPQGGLRDGRSDSLLIARYVWMMGDKSKWVALRPFDEVA